MEKIRFILNPHSGRQHTHPQEIKQQVLAYFPQAEFCITTGPGHATDLAQGAAQQYFDAVVAIGGDGTINETAKGLLDTQTALGMIPRGSGNGFAREMGMMLSLNKALAKLHSAQIQSCDVGMANGEPFLNMAGVGIEAAIAWQFAQHTQTGARGMLPYFQEGIKTFFSYQPQTLRVSLSGKTYTWAPLTMVFANNRQYGSHFIIAPQAAIADGKLDLVLVKNAPKHKLIAALPAFFMGITPPFNVTSHTRIQSAVVESEQEILYHIDGEPRKTAHHLEITLRPRALRLWI